MKLLDAINVRNEVDKGVRSKEWVEEQAQRLISEGFWSDGQVASIISYSSAWVGKVRRDTGARSPEERPGGGTLNRVSLDALLELSSPDSGPIRGTLIRAVISDGTGTRLISRLTGVPLGQVLYQQRKMKKEAENV